MDWEFKKGIEPQGSSNGFWYDITDGGYIRIEDMLADKEQLKKAQDAIEIVYSLERALERNDLLNEF